MNRITQRKGDGFVRIPNGGGYKAPHQDVPLKTIQYFIQCMDRLAAYEDSGLTAQECYEIGKAKGVAVPLYGFPPDTNLIEEKENRKENSK